jgi:hypothetical protein
MLWSDHLEQCAHLQDEEMFEYAEDLPLDL